MARCAPGSVALLVFAGCLQATNTGIGVEGPEGQPCTTCKSSGPRPGGTGSGSGSAGGSGSSGSRGSASGGSSGATTSTDGGSSSGGAGDAGMLQCPAGTLWATTEVQELTGQSLQGNAVPGATVTELGENGIPLGGTGSSAVSDANGNVQFCLPFNVPITLNVTSSVAPATYIEEMIVTPAAVDAGQNPLFAAGLLILPFTLIQAIQPLLSAGDAGIQSNAAFVITEITSISQQMACAQPVGWTFQLTLPDGGTNPDGGNAIPFVPAYFNSFGVPALGLTETSKNGAAILYNIDTSATAAILTATNPDAGGCPLVQGVVRTTGRVTLANTAVTYAPFFTP